MDGSLQYKFIYVVNILIKTLIHEDIHKLKDKNIFNKNKTNKQRFQF